MKTMTSTIPQGNGAAKQAPVAMTLAEPELSAAPSRFVPATMDEVLKTARMFYDGGLMPKHFYEDKRIKSEDRRAAGIAGIATMILYGAELGLSPAQAMRMMHVIEGRAVLSAAGKVALVKRSPKCASFRVVEASDEHCTCESIRRGDDGKPLPPRRLTVKVWWGKIDEVPKAEKDLLYVIPSYDRDGKPTSPWLRTPGRMVKARCSDWLCGDEYEDVVAGLYSAEEVVDFRDNRTQSAMVDNIFDMVGETPMAVAGAGRPASFETDEPEAAPPPTSDPNGVRLDQGELAAIAAADRTALARRADEYKVAADAGDAAAREYEARARARLASMGGGA